MSSFNRSSIFGTCSMFFQHCHLSIWLSLINRNTNTNTEANANREANPNNNLMMRQAGLDIYTQFLHMLDISLNCKIDIQDMKVPILLLQCNNRIQFQNIINTVGNIACKASTAGAKCTLTSQPSAVNSRGSSAVGEGHTSPSQL